MNSLVRNLFDQKSCGTRVPVAENSKPIETKDPVELVMGETVQRERPNLRLPVIIKYGENL